MMASSLPMGLPNDSKLWTDPEWVKGVVLKAIQTAKDEETEAACHLSLMAVHARITPPGTRPSITGWISAPGYDKFRWRFTTAGNLWVMPDKGPTAGQAFHMRAVLRSARGLSFVYSITEQGPWEQRAPSVVPWAVVALPFPNLN